MTGTEAHADNLHIEEAAVLKSDGRTNDTVELKHDGQHLAIVTDIGSRGVVGATETTSSVPEVKPDSQPFRFEQDAEFRTKAIAAIRQALYSTIDGTISHDSKSGIGAMVREADHRFDTQDPQAIGGYLFELVHEVYGYFANHSSVDQDRLDVDSLFRTIQEQYLKILGIEKRGKVITGAIDIVHKVGDGTLRALSHVTR